MNEWIADCILIVLILIPVALIAVDIVFAVRKKKVFFFELFAFATGLVYMLLGWVMWDPPKYDIPINRMAGFSSVHEPVSTEHAPTLITIAVVGFLCVSVFEVCGKTSCAAC